MTYATGTITNGGGAGLLAKIEELLTAHASWTFIKTVTVSAYTYRVWQNAGHAWSGNRPFHVIFRTTSSQLDYLSIIAAEGFNTGDDKASGYTGGASSITADANGTRAAAALSTAFVDCVWISGIPTAATYTYWIAVTAEGVFVRASGVTEYCYVGLFDPLPLNVYPAGAEFPLVAVSRNPQFNQTSSMSFARFPNRTGTLTNYPLNAKADPTTPLIGAIPTGLAWFGGKSLLARILVSHYSSHGYTPRGLLPSWLLFSAVPETGVTLGDSITIDGTIYRHVAPTTGSTSFWLSEAA